MKKLIPTIYAVLGFLLAVAVLQPVSAQVAVKKSPASVVLSNTTAASGSGILYKGTTPWLHDFNYGNNGTVTTEGYNIFLGGAGNLTMGATASGAADASRNIGIGYQSLSSLTTGKLNTALGIESMLNMTTGGDNTAIGYRALRNMTTGFLNTAVGEGAMAANSLGTNSVAIGYNTLGDFAPASGVGYNTAVGNNTARGISTGVKNTVIGAQVSGLSSTLSNNVILADGDGMVRARAIPEFSLADATETTFAVLTPGNDTGGGGSFDYCVYAKDATTGGLECGRVDFGGIDVTAGAGGEVCPNPTKVGTPIQALSGSTLSVAFTAATGTDLCSIKVNADTNIVTPVALTIKWWAVNSGRTLTPQ